MDGTDGSFTINFTISAGNESDTLTETGTITATSCASTCCSHSSTEIVIKNYVAPTATTDGSYDVVIYCMGCGAELSRLHVTVEATGTSGGKITFEDVIVDDPVEDANTDTEDDDEESSETPEAESNPTTGIVFSILPMKIAALAAASAKRR